ncbi:c-type cytochrome domain-containing protein [Planctomicrobium sp. SH664]|uniref:WD40 domain-containing protein n=1 Tax=Planctomicrobium sp. SH664 TaxID=3448125 RepID=UPI003F5AFBF1
MRSVTLAQEPTAPVDSQVERPVDFYEDLYPILESNCIACHNSSVHEGGLVLESAELMLRGGDSGPGLVAGKPEESLIFRVAAHHDEPFMPPLPNKVRARTLTPAELELLKRWIAEGATAGKRQGSRSLDWQPIPETYRAVYSLALCPEERYLAAGRGNRIFLYDLIAQQEIGRLTDPLLLGLRRKEAPLYGGGVAHRDFVHSLAISPDGKLLASGGYREVKLWERQPATRLAELSLGEPVRALTLSADGSRAAFLLESGCIRLWHPEAATAGAQIVCEVGKFVAMAFSPDNQTLVTLTPAGLIQLHDSDTGEVRSQLDTKLPATALAIRGQGPELVTAHTDHVIRTWSWPTTEAPASVCLKEFAGHTKEITSLAISNPSNSLVSGSQDQTVRLWSFEEGGAIQVYPAGAEVLAVAMTPDGNTIVAAAANRIVRIWNRQGEQLAEISGDLERRLALQRAEDAAAIAGQQLAHATAAVGAATDDVAQRSASLEKSREEQQTAQTALTAAATTLADVERKLTELASQLIDEPANESLKKQQESLQGEKTKGEQALTAARDQSTSAARNVTLAEQSLNNARQQLEQRQGQVAELQQRQQQLSGELEPLRQQLAESARAVQCLAVTLSGSTLLTAGLDQPVQSWRITDGKPIEHFVYPDTAPVMTTVTASGLVLGVDAEGLATIWNFRRRWVWKGTLGPPVDAPLDVEQSVLIDRVQALAWSPDSRLLVTGGGEPSRSGEIQIWDVASRQMIRSIPDPHVDAVVDLAVSRDGAWLASAAADKFVRLFRMSDGVLVRSFEGHTDHVLSVAFQADGSSLASGGADQTIKIWNTETGEQRRTIEGFAKQVTALEYLGITDRLVAACGDRNVKLLNTADGKTLSTFTGAQDFLYALAATADGHWIIAGGEDGVVRVWNGQNGEVVERFDPPPATDAP